MSHNLNIRDITISTFETGKYIKKSKLEIKWDFILNEKHHKVDLAHSRLTGKRVIKLDNNEILKVHKLKFDFTYSFMIDKHYLNVVQTSVENYDLRIDNISITELINESKFNNFKKRKEELQSNNNSNNNSKEIEKEKQFKEKNYFQEEDFKNERDNSFKPSVSNYNLNVSNLNSKTDEFSKDKKEKPKSSINITNNKNNMNSNPANWDFNFDDFNNNSTNNNNNNEKKSNNNKKEIKPLSSNLLKFDDFNDKNEQKSKESDTAKKMSDNLNDLFSNNQFSNSSTNVNFKTDFSKFNFDEGMKYNASNNNNNNNFDLINK